MIGTRRPRPFWYLRRRSDDVASEIDEELDVHLEMTVEELRQQGWSAEDARIEAVRRFGDLRGTRQYCRQQDHRKERRMQKGLLFDDLKQDLRIGLRTLLRVPGLAITVILTVGIGIGATTAMFAVIHATLIRPLPYDDADRLVRIYTDSPPNKWPLSVADYLTLDRQQTQFERIAGYIQRSMSFSDERIAERVNGRIVTWTYFSVLGLRPTLGRSFNESDGRPGAPRAVIVSHGFWSRRLGSRAAALGEPLRLDGVDYALVGVLPEAVGPLEKGRDFFIAAQWSAPPRKGPFPIYVLGRLRPDADRRAAAQELRAINRRMFPIWKASYQDERATWSMISLKTHIVGDVGTTLVVALTAVGVVWLIACVNAANLLVARITGRRQELAVRAALGASRSRVLRYLLAESGVLAVGAALVGVSLASMAVGLLRDVAGDFLPRVQELALDGLVLWLLLALTTASALLFGAVPAIFGTHGPLGEALRAVGRSTTGNRRARRLRWVLAASEFAVATPLLIVAGLLAVSLSRLAEVDLGFDHHNVVTGQVALPPAQYTGPGVAVFWRELQRRLERLPGVVGVAFSDGRPPNEVLMVNNFDLEVSPTRPGESQPATPWIAVTPDYFRLLGLTLLQGRLLDERDVRDSSGRVVVVDRAWATRFFPQGNAVGARFHEGGCTTCPWLTVVGVVSTVKYAGLDSPDEGTVYWALSESRISRYVVLKTSADPAVVLPSVRDTIRQLDSSVPFAQVATIDDLVTQSLQLPRSVSVVVGMFACVAVLLSIVGIYSVMAHYVQQHSKDISIRLALGGSRSEVMRLVMSQGMKVVGTGVVLGLGLALAVTRLITGLLFGIDPADSRTFAAVALLMLSVAVLACFTPARRAIRAGPAAVLRAE